MRLTHLLPLLCCCGLVAACAADDQAPGAPVPEPPLDGQFKPTGCAFSVAPREVYKEWARDPQASGTGAANIQRVRLGLGGSIERGDGYADPSSSIAVAWQTDDGVFGGEVRWGTTADPATWPAANVATGITWLTPEGELGPLGDERMHEVYLCGLEPDTRYYYEVRSGADRSEVHSFRTTPAAGASTVRIAVTGDSRGETNNAWQILQRRIQERQPTLQLFSGDMINIATAHFEWQHWLDSASRDENGKLSSLGQTLMLVTHGNHENHTPLYFGNFVMPQSPDTFGDNLENFYSLDVGPVHVIVVDDYDLAWPKLNPPYAAVVSEWIERDLQQAVDRRAQVPWIIAMHHHAPYSSSNHGTDADVLRVRAQLVPLWEKYGVDLVLNGHDHNYERTHPLISAGDVDNPRVDVNGTTYIVCAGAGAPGYSHGAAPTTAFAGSYKGDGQLGLYGVFEASQHELVWNAYWVNEGGDELLEPPVVMTK